MAGFVTVVKLVWREYGKRINRRINGDSLERQPEVAKSGRDRYALNA